MADRIELSQPRVAKIEAAAADVSLDQMFRGLFAVGGNVEDLTAATPSGEVFGQVRVSVKSVALLTPSKSPSGPTEPPVPRRKGNKSGTSSGA